MFIVFVCFSLLVQFPFPLKAWPCHHTGGFSPDIILVAPNSHQLVYTSFMFASTPISDVPLSPQFSSQYYHLLTFQSCSDGAANTLLCCFLTTAKGPCGCL